MCIQWVSFACIARRFQNNKKHLINISHLDIFVLQLIFFGSLLKFDSGLIAKQNAFSYDNSHTNIHFVVPCASQPGENHFITLQLEQTRQKHWIGFVYGYNAHTAHSCCHSISLSFSNIYSKTDLTVITKRRFCKFQNGES